MEHEGQNASGKKLQAPRTRFEAELFGGAGNGLTIGLQEFEPQVTVFRNGGPPIVESGDVDASQHPDAAYLGVYELAGPIGPETPIYVAKSL
jgi:hypothetical protein